MAKAKRPEPLLRTPDDQLSGDEWFKINSEGVVGPLPGDWRNPARDDIEQEAQFLSKSHGVYTEYNRAKTGREKDWMYMVRCSIPGGGGFTPAQWRIFDELAEKYADYNPYGNASLRVTNRQNIQFHWVPKDHVIPLIQEIASTGFYTLNGCGDNTRNVMACPLSRFSDLHNGHELANFYGTYFRIPAEAHIKVFAVDPNHVRDPDEKYEYGPKMLNRKFKIGFSAVHRNRETGEIEYDNCVEMRTHDVGVGPIVEGHGDDARVTAYQLYVGGGQGEKNGKPTFAEMGKALGIFTPDDLMHGLKSIVDTHKEWGDRKNRHWARLKYVINEQGVDWFADQVREHGAKFDKPNPDYDPGPRHMHHGWTYLPTTGKWAYGAYVECGRLVDSNESDEDSQHLSGNVTGNGMQKTMVREVMDRFDNIELMTTPNQDLLFTGLEDSQKEAFEAALHEYGWGTRNGKPYSRLRVLSGACVGLPTCRLSYTDSEQFEPELMDTLDQWGYGEMNESIGITGCERQCFRPSTKTIGWVGQGPGMYMLKLGGSEDGRHQGTACVIGETLYMRQVKRADVAPVTAALFDFYQANRVGAGEDMGTFHRRVGMQAIIDYIASRNEISHVLEKTHKAPYLPRGTMSLDGECLAG